MKFKNSLLVVFICAFILTILFYKQGIGINLLMFHMLLSVWLLITKQINLKNKTVLIVAVGYIFTSVFTVITYTVLSYAIHFLTMFILIGLVNYSKSKSIVTAYLTAWAATVMSIGVFFKRITNTSIRGNNLGTSFYKSRIFLLPLLIIIIFTVMYSVANENFGSITETIATFISNSWQLLFKYIDTEVIFTYIFCLLISVFLLVRYRNEYLANYDKNASLQILRKRQKEPITHGTLSLKNEYKAALFLLAILNILLLVLNFLDIKNIWFGFQWDGDTLKEFVHEGTYVLIISILISIALVLYYFRRNLNFYPKNDLLKKMSYLWIFQNAILVISVTIRNFWYIKYYALAYKRIGVILFLIMTLYGLYTVFRKVQQKKSSFYLFKYNVMSVYIVLVLASGFSWDTIIASHNFSNADHSYLHLNYLKNLSDKALPYLEHQVEKLQELKENQNPNFLPDKDIAVSAYKIYITKRIEKFKEKWENKSWLAWNFAEYKAYKKLFRN